jgi:hypothetical protein
MVCLCFPGLGGCGIAVGHARTSHGLTIQPSGVVICSGAKAKRSFWARWRALPAGVSLPAPPPAKAASLSYSPAADSLKCILAASAQ